MKIKKTSKKTAARAQKKPSKTQKTSKTVKSQKKASGTAKKTASRKAVTGKKTTAVKSKPATKTKQAAKSKPAAKTKTQSRKPAVKAVIKKETRTAKKQKPLTTRGKKIQGIKNSLIMQRAALLEEAEVALNELPGQTVFPDLGDQATAETDRNFMLRLRGREQRLLKKIDEAIERIEASTFGICEDCGEDIDIKRLEARPVTTMCIECKTLQEEEEKLRAS